MLAVIFPGQGSQTVAMGKDFYDLYSSAKQIYEEASDFLRMSVTDLCFSSDVSKLSNTHHAQIAIFVTEVAMHESIQHEGLIYPVSYAGHSLGEYTALVASKALLFSEALSLVSKRGELMESVRGDKFGMLAVGGISYKKIQNIIQEVDHKRKNIDYACANSPEQHTLAGSKLFYGFVMLCDSHS